ncbi:DUF6233 domain-containing protein [Streptomyces smyrnaeus]|uniref:DUF6233 domain-containing protein n=1 Tax=Streptomyces smyrnaeus TaxID=1387713 RepID=UPI0033E04054
MAISVAAECIAPIPGESYEQVPTQFAVAGRQWLAIRSSGVHGGGPWWQLHHRSCWQARGGWRRQLVTTDEARRILATLPRTCATSAARTNARPGPTCLWAGAARQCCPGVANLVAADSSSFLLQTLMPHSRRSYWELVGGPLDGAAPGRDRLACTARGGMARTVRQSGRFEVQIGRTLCEDDQRRTARVMAAAGQQDA